MMIKRSIALLCVDLVFLLVTLGLQCWALSVLAVSCRYTHAVLYDGYRNVPDAVAYTMTQTQVGIGYASTSTRAATTGVIRTSTYTLIDLDGKTYPTTQFDTATLAAQPFGFTPTATTTRTIVTTGLGDVRAGAMLDYYYVVPTIARPTITPAIVARAERGTPIYANDMLTLDTSFDINDYRAVTVNHGFDKHFAVAGLDYDYFVQRYDGYSPSDRTRIIGLTTLMCLALFTTGLRLALDVLWAASAGYRDQDGKMGKNGRHRWLLYVNLLATFVLCATCIAFWTIYGAWTHRSAAVEDAYRAFSQDQNLVYLRIDKLFYTVPWRGRPTALVVFWCLSCTTSIVWCAILGKMVW